MNRFILLALSICMAFNSIAQNKDFYLYANGESAMLWIDANDWKGVARAAGDLSEDIGRVTGRNAELQIVDRLKNDGKRHVIIGTIGKSKLIDSLIKQKKLNVDGVRGE